MKGKPEYVDGPEAWQRFQGAMRKILTVSKEELGRREADYEKQSLASPSRRGSKRGVLNHQPRPKRSA